MRCAAALLTACLSFCGKTAQAQQTCPWLTEGTAAATLGGTPQSEVKLVGSTEGSCRFELNQGSVTSMLEIVVSTQMQSACPPGSPRLAGVGSEATRCQLHLAPGEVRYIVDSRVRSLRFRTSLTFQDHGKSAGETGKRIDAQAAAKIAQDQEDRIERIAEEVAGSLF